MTRRHVGLLIVAGTIAYAATATGLLWAFIDAGSLEPLPDDDSHEPATENP